MTAILTENQNVVFVNPDAHPYMSEWELANRTLGYPPSIRSEAIAISANRDGVLCINDDGNLSFLVNPGAKGPLTKVLVRNKFPTGTDGLRLFSSIENGNQSWAIEAGILHSWGIPDKEEFERNFPGFLENMVFYQEE